MIRDRDAPGQLTNLDGIDGGKPGNIDDRNVVGQAVGRQKILFVGREGHMPYALADQKIFYDLVGLGVDHGDVVGWSERLDKLGMSEYAQRFAENRIDFSVLPDLTDQDLEKLGVVLGDRRKMLRAIAKLDYTSAAPSSAPAPAPMAAASTAPLTTETAGERRHVTVMFCDLVDSTGMAARLDAEEWRDLVGA
jgi:SAM domain (Sterile alpha motif)